jgi:hypothetical protein
MTSIETPLHSYFFPNLAVSADARSEFLEVSLLGPAFEEPRDGSGSSQVIMSVSLRRSLQKEDNFGGRLVGGWCFLRGGFGNCRRWEKSFFQK